MSKMLNLDEMLEVCLTGPPSLKVIGSIARRTMEGIGDVMASAIAKEFNIECGQATFEGTGFAGTCCPFYQKLPGQETPEALKDYDQGEELGPRP